MKQIFLTLTLLVLVLSAQNARADILADTCEMQTPQMYQNLEMHLYANNLGLTCDQLKAVDEYKEIAAMTIHPFATILATPMFKAAMAEQLALWGLTPPTAAVLTVTIVGTMGIRVLNIALKDALSECAERDRQTLKQEIIESLELKYDLRAKPTVNLEIIQ